MTKPYHTKTQPPGAPSTRKVRAMRKRATKAQAYIAANKAKGTSGRVK